MIPNLLQLPVPFLGALTINSFGLMIALCFLAGMQVMAQSFQRNRINPALADRYALTAGFVGLAGARVWYILTFYDQVRGDLWGAVFSSAGFIFYGGFIFAAAAIILMARRDELKLSSVADSFGPALALAYAVGRVGCQLSGDGDYGIATSTFWGMSYETGVIPTPPGVKAFPAPLYESAASLLILYILLGIENRPDWQAPWRRFGAYLSMIALERFMIEFIRINPKVLLIFSQAQLIAVGLMLIGLYLVISRAPARETPAGSA